jgi:hypothetical protein
MTVVSVDDTVTRIDNLNDALDGYPGETITIHNPAESDVVYLDTSDEVLTTTGLPLAAGATLTFDLRQGDAIFGICADTESTALRVLEVGIRG